ncbi:hypothetical protein AVMA1855_08580 [Acidovorax sp. SUPP1855]|uniref:hypothetical protein n=1 Tax=Acidovorax sp. SUPP1855 TaxID=431774 RepID=UPI0023DE2D82|nr:hypothetical protein [Acidovorax sp. SUPP1855]GKS84190.1 hypothetical protein AVMA1855_08580 [Acidovorax sp. SUPP1855]
MKKILASAAFLCSLTGVGYAQPISASFLDRYNNSFDYSDLISRAVDNPEAGGYFYAHKVLSECKMASSLFNFWKEKSKNSANAARDSALNLISARCVNIPAERLSDDYLSKLYVEGTSGRDPLFVASKSYSNSMPALKSGNVSQARRSEAISAALQVKDPLVVQDLGLRLVVNKDPDSGRTTFRAHGQDIPLNSKVDVGLATFLVPCEMGLNCDAKDFAVTLPCASQGICDINRHEAVKRMAVESGKDYEGITKLAKLIADSLKDQSKSAPALD